MAAETASQPGDWMELDGEQAELDRIDVDEEMAEPDLMEVDEVPPVPEPVPVCLLDAKPEPEASVVVIVVRMVDATTKRKELRVPRRQLASEESGMEAVREMLSSAGVEALPVRTLKAAAEKVGNAMARGRRRFVLYAVEINRTDVVVSLWDQEARSINRVVNWAYELMEREQRVYKHLEVVNAASSPLLDGESCSICLEEIEIGEDDDVARLPCSHSFHEACALKWLRDHNSCPLCRNKLPPR